MRIMKLFSAKCPGCGRTFQSLTRVKFCSSECRGESVRKSRGQGDPTPDEIAERCEAVQAGWSDSERYKRLVIKPRPVVAQDAGVRTIHAFQQPRWP